MSEDPTKKLNKIITEILDEMYKNGEPIESQQAILLMILNVLVSIKADTQEIADLAHQIKIFGIDTLR